MAVSDLRHLPEGRRIRLTTAKMRRWEVLLIANERRDEMLVISVEGLVMPIPYKEVRSASVPLAA